MLSVWRLTTARFARSAFSGDGARLYGGRWNYKGTPLVYTAATQALAMLEMLVQDEPLRARYVIIEARIPGDMTIDSLTVQDLPANWRDAQARPRLRALGSEWARQHSAAVLAVPSAIIPAELNYLLNPLHPAFHRIQIGKARNFETDLRLMNR
jgi:RES domain-containing protein